MLTRLAILNAARIVYLILLLAGVFICAVPSVFQIVARTLGGPERLLATGIALALFAAFVEHVRTSSLRLNQTYIARRLIQMNPELRKLEAVKILVTALNSDQEKVADSAYTELKRLTGQDHGRDPAPWHRWIRDQERPPTPERE